MRMRKLCGALVALAMLLTLAPTAWAAYDGEQLLVLRSPADGGTYAHSATLDGQSVEEFTDYVWHANPAEDHDTKDAPAEYYMGQKPETDAAVYIAHDIIYYPSLPAENFQLMQYDDDIEWCYFYPESSAFHEYVFATLPMNGSSAPPSGMMHTAEEAYQNAVLHIQKPGVYRLKGDWHGQILVDLGDQDEVSIDPSAQVTLILDNVNVNCTVAPALIFYSVYECDNNWENRSVYSSSVSTGMAGARVIIADNSRNEFSGQNVYRMLRTAYKSDDSQNPRSQLKVQKKRRKIDGAVYSFMTMRIDGETENSGVLRIDAGFEGLDSELHLTINGGTINIFSQDDGINVNEDGVSVLTINGGNVHILAGLGTEGDGIDSNGYLVMNGGTLVTMASPRADSGMDSDRGTYVNGGTVVALGSTMDWAEAPENGGPQTQQAAMNLQFASAQSADEAIIVTDTSGRIVFAYDPEKDEVAENNARWYQGAIVSSPALRVGQSYYVYVGGDVRGTDFAGIYDIQSVEGFTDAAKQQCYSATGSFARPGPPPDDNGNPPPPPMGGFGPGGMPLGNGQDFNGGNPPPPPPGGMGFGGALTNKNGKREFVMTDNVNGFQSVTDYVGASFSDIAEESDFYEPVMWAAGTGIAEGESDSVFGRDTVCTRGNAVLYLWRAAGSPDGNMAGGPPMPPEWQQGAVGANPPPPPNGFANAQDELPENPFTDVSETDAYYKAVLWAVQNGITNGMTPTTFEPNTTLNRGQAVSFLYRWAGEEQTTGTNPFHDVAEGAYYYRPTLWASQHGVAMGTTPSSFEPQNRLTKAQFLTFLFRFVDKDLMPDPFGNPPPFAGEMNGGTMPPPNNENPENMPPSPPSGENPENMPPSLPSGENPGSPPPPPPSDAFPGSPPPSPNGENPESLSPFAGITLPLIDNLLESLLDLIPLPADEIPETTI